MTSALRSISDKRQVLAAGVAFEERKKNGKVF
jgi:hypothetical protein